MFLNNQSSDVNDATGGDVWRLFPQVRPTVDQRRQPSVPSLPPFVPALTASPHLQEFPSNNNTLTTQHKDLCSRIKFLPAIDKYVTAGADGTMRLWQAQDLSHFRTIGGGASWITDFVYSPSLRQIVTTSMDRAVRLRSLPPLTATAAASVLSPIVQCSGSPDSYHNTGCCPKDAITRIIM